MTVPAEWAPHRAMWLGFPSHAELWQEDLEFARQEVAALARALAGPGAEQVKLLTGTPEGEATAGALLGGIAMGYGARLSNGCNIGAYFSAIAAGNLSGWAWMLLALAGSWLGVQLRPLFGLGRGATRAEGPTC